MHARIAGNGGRIGYTLLDTFDGLFSIDENSGALVASQSLDRESVAVYNLTVVATDNGEPTLSSSGILGRM